MRHIRPRMEVGGLALTQHVNPVTLGTGAHGRQEEARKEESAGEENGREAEMITIPCPPS